MDISALAKQEEMKKQQKEHFSGYMSQRALKFGIPQNQGPFAKHKLRTQETLFVNKSSYTSKPKVPEVNKAPSDNDDCGLEIDFGEKEPTKLFPLNMNKKSTFA